MAETALTVHGIQARAVIAEIDLATARATLERAAAHADALLEGNPVDLPLDDLQHVAKDFQ